MDALFIETLYVTFKLALFTTAILIVIGMPLANWLAVTKSRGKTFVEALVSMPMVLPPSVIGYYVMVLYSPQNAFGKWLFDTFQMRLAFTFEGVLIASVIFSLPFMVQPLYNGIAALPKSLREASYSFGKSRITTFFKVVLPSAKNSVFTAIALTFAHCIGEFGIVLMVGGSRPGETLVASIAIYDQMQINNYTVANNYAFILFAVSFVILLLIYGLNKKTKVW